MKKTLLIIVFILISINGFCQKLRFFYQDEKGNNISFSSYRFKLSSGFYYATSSSNDATLINGMKFKEEYGQLDLIQKKQLNKLYAKRNNIDSTKTWLIHYIDSLPNIRNMPKTTGLYSFNEFETKIAEEIKSRRFYHFAKDSLLRSQKLYEYKGYVGYSIKIALNYNDYKKISLQEHKKYAKFESVELIHFFELNKGYPKEDIKKEKLFQDEYLVLKKIFNKNVDDDYHIIVIYPNGKYYKVYSREIFKVKERQILKYKSFTRLEKLWKKKVKNLN